MKAGPGESIERVTVMPVDDKPVFDPAAGGGTLSSRRSWAQPTDAVCEAVAIFAGGKKITARYPQIGEWGEPMRRILFVAARSSAVLAPTRGSATPVAWSSRFCAAESSRPGWLRIWSGARCRALPL